MSDEIIQDRRDGLIADLIFVQITKSATHNLATAAHQGQRRGFGSFSSGGPPQLTTTVDESRVFLPYSTDRAVEGATALIVNARDVM